MLGTFSNSFIQDKLGLNQATSPTASDSQFVGNGLAVRKDGLKISLGVFEITPLLF